MGIYGCFFGREHTVEKPSYFATPIFIYFQAYLMIIVSLNCFFFGSTMKTLHEGFQNQRKNFEAQGREQDLSATWNRLRTQFMTIMRLCILMGMCQCANRTQIIVFFLIFCMFLGIWWVCELITTALAAEYDFNNFCYLRLILDLPNLLSVSHFLSTFAKNYI